MKKEFMVSLDKIDLSKGYVPKDYLASLGMVFISFLPGNTNDLSNDKSDTPSEVEIAFEKARIGLGFCLESYFASLSFEMLKDTLKKQSMEQIYSDENVQKLYERAVQDFGKEMAEKIELSFFIEQASKPGTLESLEDWKLLKKELKKQVPEVKNFNDYEIMKILRDCYVHNNESGDNYQKRLNYGDKIEFSFLLDKKKHCFTVDRALISSSFELLGLANKTSHLVGVGDNKCFGVIYSDSSVEDFDFNQKLFIKKMLEKNPDADIRRLPLLKNNSFYMLSYINTIKNVLADLKYEDSGTFPRKILKEQPDIRPLGRNFVQAILMISCLHYTMVNSKPEDMASVLLKTSNSQMKNFTFDEAKFFVQKLRNSIVHGRFFYNPYVGRGGLVIFYDEPRKGTPKKEFEDLDEDLQKLYSYCIEKGFATKKVNQLTQCASFSLEDMVAISTALIEGLEYDDDRKATEEVMRKFSKKHSKNKLNTPKGENGQQNTKRKNEQKNNNIVSDYKKLKKEKNNASKIDTASDISTQNTNDRVQ